MTSWTHSSPSHDELWGASPRRAADGSRPDLRMIDVQASLAPNTDKSRGLASWALGDFKSHRTRSSKFNDSVMTMFTCLYVAALQWLSKAGWAHITRENLPSASACSCLLVCSPPWSPQMASRQICHRTLCNTLAHQGTAPTSWLCKLIEVSIV